MWRKQIEWIRTCICESPLPLGMFDLSDCVNATWQNSDNLINSLCFVLWSSRRRWGDARRDLQHLLCALNAAHACGGSKVESVHYFIIYNAINMMWKTLNFQLVESTWMTLSDRKNVKGTLFRYPSCPAASEALVLFSPPSRSPSTARIHEPTRHSLDPLDGKRITSRWDGYICWNSHMI